MLCSKPVVEASKKKYYDVNNNAIFLIFFKHKLIIVCLSTRALWFCL